MDALGRGDVFLFEGFRLDPRGGGLSRRDERGSFVPVAISSRALGILGVLVERPGDLVSRDAIITAVWPTTVVEDNNLSTQIAALRRVLDQGRGEASCIQTVSGRGYRFLAPVTRVDPAPSSQSTPSSGNGGIGPIVENEQLHDPGFLSQIDAPPPAPALRARHRFRGTIAAALIGGLGLVVAVAGWNWHSPWFGEVRLAPRLSIVVLPFTNLNSDPDQQYFADAVTEDLTTDLSRIAHMFVISRNTAFTYLNKPTEAKQIGHELGVRYVLDGSVQRSGNQVRINARLIDAETSAHIWAERFDRDTSDLFALQNEITRRLAQALDARLIAAEAARPTEHPDALDYILRGRAVFNHWPTHDNYAQAIRLLERALTLDPQSVEAKSWLAHVLAIRVLREQTETAAADISHVEQLVEQVLAAAPRNSLAHFVKGQVLRAQSRCKEAIPEYETAIASNPNFPPAYANLGECKFAIGSIEEVIGLQEQAIRVGPGDPFLGALYGRIGLVHLVKSQYQEAIASFEKARIGYPAHIPHVHGCLASAYALLGETERATAELAEARRLNPDDRYSSIARLKAAEHRGPAILPLLETTYYAGLRKAGMPEE